MTTNWTRSQRKRHKAQEAPSPVALGKIQNQFTEWNRTKKEALRLDRERKNQARKVADRLLGIKPGGWTDKAHQWGSNGN